MDKKIYKVKSSWVYSLLMVAYPILLITDNLFRGHSTTVFISGSFLFLIGLYYFLRGISYKFIVNYEKKEIEEVIINGLISKKIKIDDIKEYCIRKDNQDFIHIKFWGHIFSRVNLRLDINGNEVLKDLQWAIPPEEAKNIFLEAEKINGGIISSEEAFYDDPFLKRRKKIFLIIPLVIMLIIFFIIFFNMLNAGSTY